ncbi:MAG: diacylglycerol kinase family protein [Bacteroidota bacterium]
MKKTAILKSFAFAFKGLKAAWNERNFKLHLLSTAAAVSLGLYCDIKAFEWLVVLICIGLVLGLEIINTAIEELVDLVSPGFNEKAGKIKDLAAAAVLVASIIALIMAAIIFLPYLY